MTMAASFGGASNFTVNNSTFTHVAGAQHNYNMGGPSGFDAIPLTMGAVPPEIPNRNYSLPPQQAHPTLDSSSPLEIEGASDTPGRRRPHGRQRQWESRSSTMNPAEPNPPHPSHSATETRRSTMETHNSPQRQCSGPLPPERTPNQGLFAVSPLQTSLQTDPNVKLHPLQQKLLEKLGEQLSDPVRLQCHPPLKNRSGSTLSTASTPSASLVSRRLGVLRTTIDNPSNGSRQPSPPACSRKSTGSTLSPSTPTASSHSPLADFELLSPPKPSHPLDPPPGRFNTLPTPPPSRSSDATFVPPPPPPPLPSGRPNTLHTPPLSASPTSDIQETPVPSSPSPSPPPLPPRPPSLTRLYDTLSPNPQYRTLDTSTRFTGAPNGSAPPPLPPPPPTTTASIQGPHVPREAHNLNTGGTLPMSPTHPTVHRMDSFSTPVLVVGRPLEADEGPWLEGNRMVGSPTSVQNGLPVNHEYERQHDLRSEFRGRPQFQSMHALDHQLAPQYRSFTAPQMNTSPYAHPQGQIPAQTQDPYFQDIQAHAAVRRESYGVFWSPNSDPFSEPELILDFHPTRPTSHQDSFDNTYTQNSAPTTMTAAPPPAAWVSHVNQPMLINGNGHEHHSGYSPGYTLPSSMRYDQGPPPAQPGPRAIQRFSMPEAMHFGPY